METIAVGDRVSWDGWTDMGTRKIRCSGTVLSVDCGVPYYYDPPRWMEFAGREYPVEAGRHPAALIRVDGRDESWPDIVVRLSSLSK